MQVQAVSSLREYWLSQAVGFLADHMAAAGLSLPVAGVRVSCGWPSQGGLASSGRVVIGQCFSPLVCKDGTAQIFVSPRVDDSIQVLGVLLHELVHAAVGNQYGHRKEFSQAARRVGLSGPPTATVVGDALRPLLVGFVERVGPYPHAALRPAPKARTGSRLRLYECACAPPFKVRIASDGFLARCERCGAVFEKV
jgi:hypothetical protein